MSENNIPYTKEQNEYSLNKIFGKVPQEITPFIGIEDLYNEKIKSLTSKLKELSFNPKRNKAAIDSVCEEINKLELY